MNNVRMKSSAIGLSVVVLSYNREEEIRRNLPILCAAADDGLFQLVVVDNASTDGSPVFLMNLEKTWKSLEVVYNKDNVGVAQGRNSGGIQSCEEFILFLDDDSRIDIPTIKSLTNYIKANSDVGVASPRVVHALTGFPQNDHGTSECEVGNYHGSCHITRGDIYRRVEGIDPLCNFGGEELDYSIRVRALGYKVMYVPFCVVEHNNYVRSGKAGQWRRQRRVYNFCRLHFKYFPLGAAFIFSFRYLISHMVSGARTIGVRFILKLPAQAFFWCLEGAESIYSTARMRNCLLLFDRRQA